MRPKAIRNGYVPSVGLLLAMVLQPIGATAQNYSIPGGYTVGPETARQTTEGEVNTLQSHFADSL
jgi:hypothetical protein